MPQGKKGFAIPDDKVGIGREGAMVVHAVTELAATRDKQKVKRRRRVD